MKNISPYFISISENTLPENLINNLWIVILHCSRVPPHAGLLINGNYNSLTIKGHETNIDLPVLLKTIHQKKIETVFIKLKKHPVFSLNYQKEICQLYIKQFPQVKPNEASCLSPIKLFLNEFYAISTIEHELLYELIERLKQNDYITESIAMNIDSKVNQSLFHFPLYTFEQLQEVILKEVNNINKK